MLTVVGVMKKLCHSESLLILNRLSYLAKYNGKNCFHSYYMLNTRAISFHFDIAPSTNKAFAGGGAESWDRQGKSKGSRQKQKTDILRSG